MNLAEALDSLEHGSQRERLEAARWLARSATASDLPELRKALRIERLPWIRSALEASVARASLRGIPLPQELDLAPLTSEEALTAEIYARATEELTDRFVHELRPLLGLARVWAEREIPEYEASETAAVLAQMQDLLRAVDTLGRAAASPKTVEFDLAQIVQEIVTTCNAEFSQKRADHPATLLEGPEPLITATDPDLLALAVRNGIRNAIEASSSSREPVLVTWGQSNTDLWVAVLDAGDGLRLELAEAMSPGTSTKSEHLGMGLAIARQAMSSLSGTILLESTSDALTRFEVSCPRGAS
jgi:signal transduction histidine kinase